MTTPNTTTRRPSAKRIQRLIERHLRLRAKGIEKFEASREALQKAMACGLTAGQFVDVPGSGVYLLVDNFANEKTGGWATVSRFDLKKAPKSAGKKSDPVASAVSAESAEVLA